MPRAQRMMVAVVFLGVLVWIGLTVATGVGVHHRLPERGFRVPDFALTDLNGRTVTPSLLAGRPWLLHFWASWCSSCLAELPELVAFAQAHPEVTILWVSVGEQPLTVRRSLDGTPLRGLVGVDPDQALASQFRVRGLPATFWIDARGVIREVMTGPMTRAQMEALLPRLDPNAF